MAGFQLKDFTANCAVCGGPGEPDCPCESNRLQQCINQAETRWIESWITKTREWVTNQAINTVTTMFERKKEARRQLFKQQIMNIPYFPMYQQHRGHPPLDPRLIYNIQRGMQEAEMRLKQGIDQDWKQCVIRYPEVLNHFFNQVHMQIPSSPPPFGQALAGGGQPRPASVVNPSIPPPPQSMVGMSMPPRSATAQPKKNRESRRSSKVGLDPNGMDFDTMAMLTQKLEGLPSLGRSNTGRTKAATPAPQATTPAPRTGRPSNKRQSSSSSRMQSAYPPPPPPPPPSVPQPPGYDQMRASFLGSLGSLGQLGH